MYYFFVAHRKNYHNIDGLKQQGFILSQFWIPEGISRVVLYSLWRL
jgi:hypothetical protein